MFIPLTHPSFAPPSLLSVLYNCINFETATTVFQIRNCPLDVSAPWPAYFSFAFIVVEKFVCNRTPRLPTECKRGQQKCVSLVFYFVRSKLFDYSLVLVLSFLDFSIAFFSKNLYADKWVDLCLHFSTKEQNTNLFVFSFTALPTRDIIIVIVIKLWKKKRKTERNEQLLGVCFHISYTDIFLFRFLFIGPYIAREGVGGYWRETVLIKEISRDQKRYNKPKLHLFPYVGCSLRVLEIWNSNEKEKHVQIANKLPIWHAQQSNKKCERWCFRLTMQEHEVETVKCLCVCVLNIEINHSHLTFCFFQIGNSFFLSLNVSVFWRGEAGAENLWTG